MSATVLSSPSGLRLLPAISSGAWADNAMDRQGAEAANQPLPLGQSVSEILSGVRALVADEADLLAAAANVAVRTVVACVFVAVAAAVFGVLGVAGWLAVIAVRVRRRGYRWATALGRPC